MVKKNIDFWGGEVGRWESGRGGGEGLEGWDPKFYKQIIQTKRVTKGSRGAFATKKANATF